MTTRHGVVLPMSCPTTGAEAGPLLRDAGAIQRTVADCHSARRYAQEWTEEALRDYHILREEVERVVRAEVRSRDGDAGGLSEQSEETGLRALAPGGPAAES
jgi:hypothetical protein